MAELVNPVVRRKPGDSTLYLLATQAGGWNQQRMALRSVEDLARIGFLIGQWQTDEHGDFALATRPQ